MNKILATILETPAPKGITASKVKSLIQEVAEIDTNPKLVYSARGEKILKELDKFGVKDIPQNYRGVLLEHWLELLSQNQENVTEIPEYSDPNLAKTTINKDESAQLINEAEKRARQQAEIREKSKQEVKQGIETKQRIYDLEQQREKDKQNEELLKQFFKGKKVVVVPTEEIPSIEKPLTAKEKEALFNATILAHENPALLQKEIEKKIVQSINNSPDTDYQKIIPELIVSKTSINLTEQLQSMSFKSITDIPDKPKMFNQTSIFIPFTNPNDPALIKVIPDKATREKFTEEMQLLVTAKESERIVNTAGTKAVYGESIAYSIYGPDNTTSFQISEDKNENDDGLEIDLQEVYKNSKEAVELFKKVRSAKKVGQVTETGLTYYPTYTQTGNITKSASSVITKAIPATVGAYTFSKSAVLSQWVRSGTPLLSAGNQHLVRLITSQAGVQEIASASMVTFSKPIGFQLGRFSIAFTTGTNQSLGTQIAVGGVRFGEKMAGAIAVKGGTQVAIVTGTQAGGQLAAGASTALTKVLTFIGGLSSWATAGLSLIGGYIVGKVIEAGVSKFKVWWSKNKETIAPFLAVGAGLSLARFGMGPAILGGAGTFLMFGGTASALLFGPLRFFAILGRNIGITIATPVIVTLLIIPPLVAFIMLVINNSAYVVPPSFLNDATIGPPPIGGIVSACEESEETGPEITDQIAARVRNGIVKLLPETVWGRRDGICIKPTMIIMHWSGGTNDNPNGNERTYETLVARNLSCQLATDTNDTWIMQKFFDKMVEFPACAGEWNTFSINNEMAGVYFTASPPPPNAEELELAYDATCEIMQQYDIPWYQIYGHYDVPNNNGKTDPGREFLEKVFIPEIERRCPNSRIQ